MSGEEGEAGEEEQEPLSLAPYVENERINDWMDHKLLLTDGI